MKEVKIEKIKRALKFEKSGEIISVEIELENISPQTDKKTLSGFLNQLFEDAKEAIPHEIRGITVNLHRSDLPIHGIQPEAKENK